MSCRKESGVELLACWFTFESGVALLTRLCRKECDVERLTHGMNNGKTPASLPLRHWPFSERKRSCRFKAHVVSRRFFGFEGLGFDVQALGFHPRAETRPDLRNCCCRLLNLPRRPREKNPPMVAKTGRSLFSGNDALV